MSNKFKFIQAFLENEKLNLSQKERFFKLVSKELESSSNINITDLKQDIDDIKKKLGIKNSTKEEEMKTTTGVEILYEALRNKKNLNETNLPKYIDPFSIKGISKFLQAYNENPILKSTCHELDSESSLNFILEYCQIKEYDFNIHLQKIKSEFEKLTKEYNINKKIYSLIRGYIYGGVKWSTDKLLMSWSDIDLLYWSKENTKNIPNPGLNFIERFEKEGYSLNAPFISTLTGKNITTFSDFVLLFKAMFHINSNNSLKNHLLRTNKKMKFYDWADVEINTNRFADNIHLYTDVDKLIQTYVKLIELIKSIVDEYDIKERPKIKLSFYENKDNIVFSIHHLNTLYKKSLQSTLNHPFGNSLSPIIDKQINGLCNMDLQADFDNKDFAIINLWNGSEIKIQKVLEEFRGVEYMLKFKR